MNENIEREIKISLTKEQYNTAEKLFNLARQAREHAYAPYSAFRVGAEILSENNNCYSGSNVENVS